MTDDQLRKLNRSDLLELLIAQGKEMEVLRRQMRQAEEELNCRRICLEEAGSIAEASLRLNGVFQAAQTAADLYLESVRAKCEETESRCSELEAGSAEEARRIMAEAEERASALERETEAACRRMVAQAEKESQEYWLEVSRRLEKFYDEHIGLRELLSVDKLKRKGT